MPLFCFEIAVKCFYFSNLIYYFTETGPGALTERDTGRGDASISKAFALFRLTEYKLFFDARTDIRVLVGWNIREGTILIAFRGTWGRTNVMTDLQFFRVAHPPTRGSPWRGTRPLVHAGFLRAWRENGLNLRVTQLVFSLINSAEGLGPDQFRVIVTGHSLGGALASLAAFEIAKACSLRRAQILVYTFGCPRVGNEVCLNLRRIQELSLGFLDSVSLSFSLSIVFHPLLVGIGMILSEWASLKCSD